MKQTKDVNTEQAILQAAEKLFLEKGFAMTSTTEIAKAAGCNQALVHYYFRTKEKLFEGVFESKIRLFSSIFFQISKEDIPFEEKLKRKIEAHFDVLRANPKLPFLIFNELTTNPDRLNTLKARLQEVPRAVYNQMKNELNAEIKKGNVRKIDAIDLLLSIIALNVSLFVAKPIFTIVADMSEAEFDKIAERRKKINVDIILNGIRP